MPPKFEYDSYESAVETAQNWLDFLVKSMEKQELKKVSLEVKKLKKTINYALNSNNRLVCKGCLYICEIKCTNIIEILKSIECKFSKSFSHYVKRPIQDAYRKWT